MTSEELRENLNNMELYFLFPKTYDETVFLETIRECINRLDDKHNIGDSYD